MSYVELFEDSDPEPKTRKDILQKELELDDLDKPQKIRRSRTTFQLFNLT